MSSTHLHESINHYSLIRAERDTQAVLLCKQFIFYASASTCRLAVLFKDATKATGNNLYIILHYITAIFYKPLQLTAKIHIHSDKSAFVPCSLKLSKSLMNFSCSSCVTYWSPHRHTLQQTPKFRLI